MDLTALWLSLVLASSATAILAAVGIPLSYWLASTPWRGRRIVNALVALPLVLPPTVLGFYLLLLLSPQSLIGRFVIGITGLRIPFTFPGILIGTVVANLPFAVRPLVASFAAVNRDLIEASWCLGVSYWSTFWRITFPLAWPGILAGLVLVFAHTLGEFGVVLMIGGNIPGVTRTLSIAIYDNVQSMDYAAANSSAFILLIVAFGMLSLIEILHRKGAMG